MAQGPRAQQLQALTAGLSAEEWHLLGALAAEERLGGTALAAVGRAAGMALDASRVLAFAERGLAAGLLVSGGEVRSLDVRATGLHEPSYALRPAWRQLVLRAAQARGSLAQSTQASAAVLGQRSQGLLSFKLQAGALLLRPESARPPALDVERLLRESVCEPFDLAWFERTWRSQMGAVATRVLRHALPTLEPCTELYAWASTQLHREQAPAGLVEVLAQHALLRQQAESCSRWAARLPASERFAFLAGSKAVQGERGVARVLIEQSLGFSAAQFPRLGAVAPLLVLLLVGERTESSSARANKWLRSRAFAPEHKGAARALRALLRYQADPEASHRRIDAYQLPASTEAWELLILGLIVHAHLEQPATRSAWSKLLLGKAQEWNRRDYGWMAAQAWHLARRLDPERTATVDRDAELAPSSDAALELAELVLVRAPWEATLLALDELVLTEIRPETNLRLEWFLNMVDGSILRPGLQEFFPRRGWSTVRRVTRDEAYDLCAELPPEDRRVLECSFVDADGQRLFSPEAYEALIGHPRVLNGARGELPVEVVRGDCRVEAHREGEFLTIRVTPPDLVCGVNVRVSSESRLSVVRVPQAMHSVSLALSGELRVPHQHAERALTILGKLAESVEISCPEAAAESTVAADATPCLRVLPVAGAWIVQAGVRPFGAGGRFFVEGTGARALGGWVGGRRLRTERHFEDEARRLQQLISSCPGLLAGYLDGETAHAPGESRQSWSFSTDEMLSVLAELRDCGLPCELEWPEAGQLGLRGKITARNLHGSLRAKKGWYLVSGSIDVDDVTTLSLAELVALPTVAQGRFVRLPTGDFLELEARVRRLVATLARAVPSRVGAELRLHESSIHALRVIADAPRFEFDEETRARLARFDTQSTAEFEVPEGLRARLRRYQREGFRWLSCLGELGFGACLADDMGLGKTIQILAFLLTRTSREPILIVAPTSVCTNWVREIERFAPGLLPVEYMGNERAGLLSDPERRVVVCSYALLQQDAELLARIAWDTVVLDEAQFIKNARSLRAQAAFALRARHRIAATGTPVENHLGDLWSIFHFLQPELLGAWESFNVAFVKPIERDGDRLVRETLSAIVQPYVLRRMKSQVLSELPALTTVRHELVLSRQESLRYGLLRRQIHGRLRTALGKRQNKLEVLAEITRLRRFCCHPRLVFPEAEAESSKIDAFLDLVSELQQNDHRALVFSQYVDFLGLVRERLDELGLRYEYLDGRTPKSRRQAAVDAFQSGSAQLFLISLKAGGLGLNLTAADYVIHLDPWWNPAAHAQATDRAHRLGQIRPVTVYQFVTRDTIEEDILELHESKRSLAETLLEGGERVAGLSTTELLAWIERGGLSGGEDAERA